MLLEVCTILALML